METGEGALLHDGDTQIRREAAAALGRARTPRKADAARTNQEKAAAARRGKPMSQDHKDAIAAARLAGEARRREAAGQPDPATVEKRPPGRPRKERPAPVVAVAAVNATGEKRGRGRPRKERTA